MDIEKFKNITFEKRENCCICGQKISSTVIEFPQFPMTEIYTKELIKEKVGFLDQSFHFCTQCGHSQLAYVIDTELQYGNYLQYHFRTSRSTTGSESVDYFVDFLQSIIKDRYIENIVEIGCNDLYLLQLLKSRAKKLIGIDPILKSREKEISNDGITAIGDFFENVRLEDDLDVVICKDVLEHISNPRGTLKKIIEKGTFETLYIFQFPLLETLLMGYRFDHIFHQHLNYFSMKSIRCMLDEFGCELIDFRININHWGAILIAFKKGKKKSRFFENIWEIKESDILERYTVFKENIHSTSRRLASMKNETVYGYGAALMLPVLSYHLKNDFSDFECIMDDDRNKDGLYYINLPVAIRLREKIHDIRNSIVLITAIASMNNVRRMLPKLFKLNPKQILLPLNNI